jgi:hypothetical protein
MANEKSIPPVDDVGVRGVEALKSAASGWKAIQAGKTVSRQERIIKEREEKAARIREGKPLTEENNFKPGDDELYNEAPTMKRLMENYKQKAKVEGTKKVFNGPANMVVLKLIDLFEKGKPTIVGCEESGFNTYKLTYLG